MREIAGTVVGFIERGEDALAWDYMYSIASDTSTPQNIRSILGSWIGWMVEAREDMVYESALRYLGKI